MEHKLIAFNSTHESLKAEDLLIRNGIFVNPIPIPRHIRADCSLGLLVKITDLKKGETILSSEDIEFKIHETK